MMDSDIYQAAVDGAKALPDPRIRFFFDPGQISGKAFAESLGHKGEVAWDMYMFFLPDTRWNETAPLPEQYMHQLADSWADQSRLFEDYELGKELQKEFGILLHKYEDK